MDDGTTLHGATPHEIGLLRGGPRAAVTVAVVAGEPRGAVGPGPPGRVRAVRGPGAGGRAPAGRGTAGSRGRPAGHRDPRRTGPVLGECGVPAAVRALTRTGVAARPGRPV